jgi:hypothetical protein
MRGSNVHVLVSNGRRPRGVGLALISQKRNSRICALVASIGSIARLERLSTKVNRQGASGTERPLDWVHVTTLRMLACCLYFALTCLSAGLKVIATVSELSAVVALALPCDSKRSPRWDPSDIVSPRDTVTRIQSGGPKHDSLGK